MQAVVCAVIVGVLLVFLFSVSIALDKTQQRWRAEQKKYERASQAIVMLADLYEPIAKMVEVSMGRKDASLAGLAWEVLQRHKAACEFARGTHV